MGDINLVFGVITAGCGIYCLWQWIKIRKTGVIADNSMILPRDCTADSCIDLEEFLAQIMPRLLVFGVLITLFGLFGLADAAFGFLDQWMAGATDGMRLLVLELVTCIIPLAVVIWFAVCLRRIQKRLW